MTNGSDQKLGQMSAWEIINSTNMIHSLEMDDYRKFDISPFKSFWFQTFQNFRIIIPEQIRWFNSFDGNGSIVRFDSYKA